MLEHIRSQEQENQQLKEQMVEIVKYKELDSCSTATQYMAKENVYKMYDTRIKQLKEENERLQEQKDFWRKEFADGRQQRKLYKSVIDEVREYITIYRSYANINGKDYLKGRDEIGELDTEQVDDLLQILDKVKEVK